MNLSLQNAYCNGRKDIYFLKKHFMHAAEAVFIPATSSDPICG